MPADEAQRALHLVRLLNATAALRDGRQVDQTPRGMLRAAPLRPGSTGGKRRDALPALVWYGEVTGAIEGIEDERRRVIARAVIVEYRSYRTAARLARCGKGTVERVLNGEGGLWEWWERLVERLGLPR
jgi:hypothetical protein